jgi:hypothetical protein
MVQIASSLLVLASLAISGLAAPNAKRTVTSVVADIGLVNTDATKLDADVKALGPPVTSASNVTVRKIEGYLLINQLILTPPRKDVIGDFSHLETTLTIAAADINVSKKPNTIIFSR